MRLGQIKHDGRTVAAIFEGDIARPIPAHSLLELIRRAESESIALPALAVVGLFAFTLSWNEFLYALVFIGSDSQKTLTLGLIGLVRGDTFPWGPMMAASLMGTLPPTLVYLVSQRWVVSGLAAGSVKG